jgi:hypothetical protein
MRWLIPVLLMACGPDSLTTHALSTPDATPEEALTCAEDAILSLLNDTDTTAETLQALGLRSSAAYHLVHARLGADGVPGTGDDPLYTSLQDVDAVPYVGPVTLEILEDWAEALCASDTGAPLDTGLGQLPT